METKKAANDDALRPLWPAEAQVYVRQAIYVLGKVEGALVKQDHTLLVVVEDMETSIRRIRKAIRVVTKGLR